MPIYRVKIHGVDNELFVRADSAAKAKDQVMTTEALSNEELVAALDEGLKVYKAGESVLGTELKPEVKEPQLSEEDIAAAEAGPQRGRRRSAAPHEEKVEDTEKVDSE